MKTLVLSSGITVAPWLWEAVVNRVNFYERIRLYMRDHAQPGLIQGPADLRLWDPGEIEVTEGMIPGVPAGVHYKNGGFFGMAHQ